MYSFRMTVLNKYSIIYASYYWLIPAPFTLILKSPWGEMTKKISNEELNMRIKTTRVSDTILMKNAMGLAMP